MGRSSINKKSRISSQQIRLALIIIVTFLSISFVFHEHIILILYGAIGLILAYYTMLYGKVVPFVAPETATAMTIVAGMMFGAKTGFLYGLLVSIIAYAACGWIKHTTIINSFVIGTGGLYAGLFLHIFSSPYTVFAVALLVRTVTGVVIFRMVTGGIDMEALIHALFDPVLNIFIYMQIFVPLYLIFF